MSASLPYKQFFTSHKVSELIDSNQDFNLISVNEGDSIANVIETLAKNQISSVPVLSKDKNQIIGSMDVVDLVWYACCKLNVREAEVYTTKKQAEQFQKPVDAAVLNISNRNYMVYTKHTDSLSELVNLLSRPNIHRVYVLNEAKDFVGMVTQSSLLKYLLQNSHLFGNMLDRKVSELFTGAQPLKTINMDESVINALQLMMDSDVSGVGVIDNEGKLVANISASDIKRVQLLPPIQLTFDMFEPISVFSNIITKEDRKFPSQVELQKRLPTFEPQCVGPNDSLKQVLNLIESKKIHRVYVVDEKMAPLRVISLCDIIGLFK